jgi:dTDP-4-amino-4,6-dideoxygalactose transaminase
MEDYPNAFDMYKNEITLPLHTLLSDDDVEYVVESLKEIINEIK